MSTKTTIKRIALVAAVAAAFGGLSTVAANAAALQTISTTSGTSISTVAAGTNLTSNDVVGAYSIETVTSGTTDHVYTITSSGVGSLAFATPSATGYTNSTSGAGIGGALIANPTTAVAQDYIVNSATSATWYAGTTPGVSAFGNASVLQFSAYSAVAGTQTITVTGDVSGTVTHTITWGATPVATAQYSTAYINTGATIGTSDGTSLYGANTANGLVANIAVELESAASTPINGAGLSVTVTGPGSLGLAQSASTTTAIAASTSGTVLAVPNTGRSLSIAASGSTAYFLIGLYGDGTSGTATVTISSGTTVIATKSFVFTGSPAKVTATQNLKVLKAGGTAGHVGGTLATGYVYNGAVDAADATTVLTGAAETTTTTAADVAGLTPITVFTTDANGNPVTLSAFDSSHIKVVSSDSTVLTAGTCQASVGYTVSADGITNEINCYVLGATGAASGSKATATVELYDSTTAAWDILATPLTFTIGGSVVAETAGLDATTYAPGQPLKLTVSATDKAGNAAYDQDIAGFSTPVFSTYIQGFAVPTKLIGGVASKTVAGYAPVQDGTFTITGVDGDSVAGEALSVSAAVTTGASTAASAATDAANEATDAANAATDAANAAADAADAATSAAQDASAQAQAALAAVTALSAKITVLAAQIAKIIKKLGA
jgi:hypothetical protein